MTSGSGAFRCRWLVPPAKSLDYMNHPIHAQNSSCRPQTCRLAYSTSLRARSRCIASSPSKLRSPTSVRTIRYMRSMVWIADPIATVAVAKMANCSLCPNKL